MTLVLVGLKALILLIGTSPVHLGVHWLNAVAMVRAGLISVADSGTYWGIAEAVTAVAGALAAEAATRCGWTFCPKLLESA